MAQTLTGPQAVAPANHLIAQNYELLLNKSIDALLNREITDTSSSLSTLYQLIHTKKTPPLESIWVYSAFAFSSRNFPNEKFSDRVLGLSDLFQLICMCSASCTEAKSVVLLAPVIYEVHRLIGDVASKVEELGSKREKKLMRKIESLVNSILGFISVMCSGNLNRSDSILESDEFIRPLEDLIRLWVGNGNGEGLEETEIFKLFFPITGDELAGNGISEVAGAVIAEAFLLRLCLDLRSGVSEQELRAWTVGSISGFRNFHFFECLMRMLLEQSLPVNSLLSSEKEMTLRKVLLDAVILVDYSFLSTENMIHVSANHVLNLYISRVLVTHEATQSFRKHKDHTKALAYMNAFSSSRLPFQLVKLVSNMISIETEANKPKGMSPKAILKWLHNLEDQGIRILDDSNLSYQARLAFDASEAEDDVSNVFPEGKHNDPELGFYIDNKGTVEDRNEDEYGRANESINADFLAAARTMKSDRNGGDRKRKEQKSVEKKRRIKFQKYQLTDDSGEKPPSLENDELNSESEVEDPLAADVESEEEK